MADPIADGIADPIAEDMALGAADVEGVGVVELCAPDVLLLPQAASVRPAQASIAVSR
ncbi:hypothetical protein ABIB25_003887 [Nakamurella sp. UYEF19]|uniref:hypothetical protein n=1 Tax=Nakamurella sp. UYEF19 TaxID=1756392 RepID=UPI0033995E1F